MNELHAIIDQWNKEREQQSKREELVCNIIVGVLSSCVFVTIALWASI